MLDDRKSKDLLRGTMTDLGVGLLCYTDFQLSARIPLPTRCRGRQIVKQVQHFLPKFQMVFSSQDTSWDDC